MSFIFLIRLEVFTACNSKKCLTVTSRALTNTVGSEYEYIHEYRVTNTSTNIRRMAVNDLKTRAPFYLIRTGMVPKLNRY